VDVGEEYEWGYVVSGRRYQIERTGPDFGEHVVQKLHVMTDFCRIDLIPFLKRQSPT
jgi:hypothetical protein